MNKPVKVAPILLLRCLGQLRLADQAGRDLTPRGRKARALLAFLALSDHPVSRERLADLLWSDRGPEQARSSCRQAVFELRHLADSDLSLIVAARDLVSLNASFVTTDLAAIRAAARADDIATLDRLLGGVESGLLSDLDGLDPEFDAWLGVLRAHEPDRTLSAALTAAARCFDRDVPADAGRIVDQVQRLDPCSEEAVRLAMRCAASAGDRAALHRQFAAFRARLRFDYGAAPSPATAALFEALTGNVPPPRDQAPPDKPPAPVAASIAGPTRRRFPRWLVPAALALLVLAVVVVVVVIRRTPAPASTVPPLVAVLPFDQPADAPSALAEGLWDDTRLALSQSRAVRVLGRTTSMAIDSSRPSPQRLSETLGVDYLLEGGIRQQGERVRIVVSLTRARDGVSVWEQSFEGRLGDALALQDAVAQAIEGRIRGRLAQGGGIHARQIVTTPQVYALYSEARALIRQRGARHIDEASDKLQRAVQLDPNFAPAWASLASTSRINRHRPSGLASVQAGAIRNARRAIELAPNLAHGYAALALVEGEQSPSSERLLRRAVALDPGDSEAWNWLGNSYAGRGRTADARVAWRRSIAIDPLFAAPFDNLLDSELQLGRIDAARALVAQTRRAGADRAMIALGEAHVLTASGDYSGAAALLSGGANGRRDRMRGDHAFVLLRLGHADAAGKVWGQPSSFASVVRGERLPPEMMDGKAIGARDFFLAPRFAAYASRTLLLQQRPDLLVSRYREGFRSRGDFVATLLGAGALSTAGLNLVVALREVGDRDEADRLLAAIGTEVERRGRIDPASRSALWDVARLRAQQGATDEALQALVRAHRLGWMPDGISEMLDLAREPTLEPLRGEPAFTAIRSKILAHIARERRELGPLEPR